MTRPRVPSRVIRRGSALTSPPLSRSSRGAPRFIAVLGIEMSEAPGGVICQRNGQAGHGRWVCLSRVSAISAVVAAQRSVVHPDRCRCIAVQCCSVACRANAPGVGDTCPHSAHVMVRVLRMGVSGWLSVGRAILYKEPLCEYHSRRSVRPGVAGVHLHGAPRVVVGDCCGSDDRQSSGSRGS